MNRRKPNNREIVLDIIRNKQDVTVAEITALTGISKPTVKTVIDYYLSEGLLLEAGKGSSTNEGGKRPSLFRFNSDYGFVISLHVGPDFIYSALTDMNSDIISSGKISLGKPDVMEIIELLARITREYLITAWTQDKQLISVVIGLPGIVDSDRGISIYSPHYPEWGRNVPFVSTFRKETELDCPVHIDCVNRFQAFAEHIKGAARDTENLIIVDAMDVGLGAGVMVKGRLKRGASYLSGEIGHMVLQADGPECNCGGRGCFEALVYVKRVVEMLKTGFEGHEDSLIYANGSNQSVTIDDLFDAAEKDDPFAFEILDHIADWFAIGLNNVIMVSDPRKIVIQGVYTRAGSQFLINLKKKIDGLSLLGLQRSVELVYSELGDKRCIIGAACYGVWQFFDQKKLYDGDSLGMDREPGRVY